MNDFSLRLRLDTPLLQGGARAQEVDASGALRGTSVRGLLHTFARALLGPLLDSNPERVRQAEARLFGAAGAADAPPTFRAQDISPHALQIGKYPNRPGDPRKGERTGYRPGQVRDLVIRPRAHAVGLVHHLPAALWTVTWAAFTLGAMGARSRRGYGSLSIETAADVPSLASLGVSGALPCFPATIDPGRLTAALGAGLAACCQALAAWLSANGFKPVSRPVPLHFTFFQVAGVQQVHVGRPSPGRPQIRDGQASRHGSNAAAQSWNDDDLRFLMNECSRALSQNEVLFKESLGAFSPRLSSPLWVRFFRTSGGLVPVATFSPLVSDRTLAEQILNQLGATPLAPAGPGAAP